MEILFDMFQYPFMQRAFLAGGMISVLLGWLGVFVTTRHMSMIGDGIAHASLFFVALGIVLGVFPLLFAVIGAIVLGAVLYLLSSKTNLTGDMSTGVIFTTGMALGVVVLQLYDGYVPELMSFLFGSVLAIRPQDILVIAISAILILLFLLTKREQLTFLTLDAEGAKLAGVRIETLDMLFHIVVAVSVVLSIKLLGIILVSALLIIPSAIGRRTARTFKSFQVAAVLWSLFIIYVGLMASFLLDLPSGATIVLTGVVAMLLVYLSTAMQSK